MNESSEVTGENAELAAEQAAATAEVMRMLEEVAATFEDGLAASRRFVPVTITMPAVWPVQLLN